MNSDRLKKITIKKIPEAYLFDESVNEFGTIKDCRNIKVLKYAMRLHVDKLVLITSGNNGYSLASLAKGTPVKIVCIISRRLDNKLKKLLKGVAYQVIELNLDEKILRPEEIIAVARENDQEVIWDVTNGSEKAYMSIVREICNHMAPDYIVCPVGSGGIFLGVIEGINKYCPRAKAIGIGPEANNQSFADKLFTPWTPYAKAMEDATKKGHRVFRLSEKEIKKVYRDYKKIADVEPSSSIVFAAPDHFNFKPSDKVVFINSGKMKWK
ncbi:PLP-dependent lyase/thiolase [Candidatus Parcubacteria bacterium]|nr:PLP-dependent lyase/thiolase [Candidatus Parcubacteria bacterium]